MNFLTDKNFLIDPVFQKEAQEILVAHEGFCLDNNTIDNRLAQFH